MKQENYNIAKNLPHWALKSPHSIAVSAPYSKSNGKFSYTELDFQDLNSLSLFYAHDFIESGLKPGDKVLMFVKPSVDFSAITFALFRCGLVPIFIDPGMGRKNLLSAIEHIGPHALIAEPIVHFLKMVFPRSFSTIKKSYTMGRLGFGGTRSISKLKSRWENLKRKALEEIMHTCTKETMAAILFTSGGTGIPKAVHYNHGIFNAQIDRLQELFQLTPEDVDLPGFPLFSLFTISMGMKSAIPAMNPSKPAQANAEDLVKNINDHKATFVAGSPAIWQNLLDYCLKKKITLPSVKYLVMFGAPVSLELHKGFKEILINGDTYTPYGATECLPVANISGTQVIQLNSLLLEEQRKKGTSTCVGLPVQKTEVRIAPITDTELTNAGDIHWLDSDQIGEVCIYSETVTPEYIGMPVKTKMAKIADSRGGLWHRMGDLGSLDSQGRLWFSGRLTHRLNIGGEVTPCIPQESIFNSLSEIKRCAFVGPVISGKVSPTLIIQPNRKLTGQQQKEVENKVRTLDRQGNNLIQRVIFTPKLPVDVRHNIKIDRLKLKEQIETGSLS
jgi:acyl-CoA synthetase (AMP-forming)/AMP-acid ligase II